MTLSQKIANDPSCKEAAKVFSKNDHDELFQNAWIKVFNYEKRNPEKAEAVKSYKSFFFRTLKSEFIDSTRRIKRRLLNIDEISESRIVSNNEEVKTYVDFLNDWIEEEPSDEMDLFYKNIINLVIICGSVKAAVEMCPMGKTKFNHYLQEAKRKFKYEFDRNANLDHVHCVDVV